MVPFSACTKKFTYTVPDVGAAFSNTKFIVTFVWFSERLYFAISDSVSVPTLVTLSIATFPFLTS